jgi:hypothetical protein
MRIEPRIDPSLWSFRAQLYGFHAVQGNSHGAPFLLTFAAAGLSWVTLFWQLGIAGKPSAAFCGRQLQFRFFILRRREETRRCCVDAVADHPR